MGDPLLTIFTLEDAKTIANGTVSVNSAPRPGMSKNQQNLFLTAINCGAILLARKEFSF
jgi:hypothetical protein